MHIKKILPEIITIGIIIVAALCYPLIFRGLEYVPPFLFGGLRMLLAGVSILFILPLLRQPLLPPRGLGNG